MHIYLNICVYTEACVSVGKSECVWWCMHMYVYVHISMYVYMTGRVQEYMCMHM